MNTETIKALGDLPGKNVITNYTDERALPIRLERLLSFIADYQKNHDGATPTVTVMATEMSVTDQVIRFYLGRMESSGMIHRYGQNPIRIMVSQTPRLLEDARRTDDALIGSKKGWVTTTPRQRYDAAEAKRLGLARFIGEYRQKHDRAPTYKEMMEATGASAPGYVEGMITELIDRKLLARDKGGVALTNAGRIVIGLKSKRAGNDRFAGAHQANHARYEKKKAEVYAYLADYVREHGHAPFLAEISERFYPDGKGHAANASHIVKRLEEDGRVRIKPHTQRGIVVLDEHGQPIRKGSKKEDTKVTKPAIIVRDRRTCGARPQFLEAAKKAARFIHEYRQRYDLAPPQKLLSKEIGYKSASASSHIIAQMVEKGWVLHDPGHHQDYQLTDLGRLTLLDEEEAQEPIREPTEEEFAAMDRAVEEAAQAEREEAPHLVVTQPCLIDVSTGDMIVELMERGYIVRKA